MKVHHLMVPGLAFEQLERSRLLQEADQHTRLVSCFPATMAVQETTLLTGVPPSIHGVLFAGESPRVPPLIEPWHARMDTLLEGGNLDDLERRILDEAREADVLLVSGCPVGEIVDRIVDPLPVAPEGFRLRIEDCFMLCEAVGGTPGLPPDVVDDWLRTPGIERILAPSRESAGAWMAPADRGWILVAEPGWAFRESVRAFGRSDRDPVLLGFGRPWASAWPASVHDWRIAPTVLDLAGADRSGCFDAPLSGAPRLGS